MKQLLSILFPTRVFRHLYSGAEMMAISTSGDAVNTGANCICLTPDRIRPGGSAWHKRAIDLNFPFEMKLQTMLGCKDDAGADGIVRIPPQCPPHRLPGRRHGLRRYLEPSPGTEIDTWLNEHLGDSYQGPSPPCCGTAACTTGYTTGTPIPNVEDCRACAGGQLVARQPAAPHQIPITKRCFGYQGGASWAKSSAGNSEVYWGVTAATRRLQSTGRRSVSNPLDFTFIEEARTRWSWIWHQGKTGLEGARSSALDSPASSKAACAQPAALLQSELWPPGGDHAQTLL